MLVNGEEIPRAQHLLSVSINTLINRIATARLAYQDGSPAESDFAMSNGDRFVPGALIEISAGSSDQQDVLFKGVIVRQELKVREGSSPQLVVNCRHQAMKLTVGRKSNYFFDSTDSDVISELFERAGVPVSVEDSGVRHEQLVQYDASDWDFCLLRAQANGMAALTRDGRVLVQKPDISGSPVSELLFGATVIAMDLRLESRQQYASVKSVSWDKASQEVSETEGGNPGIDTPGNLSSEELAEVVGLDHYVTRHPELSAEEAGNWSGATWLESQINRVSGRIKCEGIGSIQVGDMVTLSGVGARFSGNAYVTGVRHEFDLAQGWKTHLQFGGIEALDPEKSGVSAPKAAGLLPAVNGLQIATVVSNEDPENEFRVRVKMPLADPDDEGAWARVACLDAGSDRGFFIRPEIGDEVVLGFLNDDPRQAMVLGMLNSSANPAPLEGSDQNHEKVYQSRSGMKLYFDDEKKILKLETPAGNTLSLDEDEQSVVLKDQHDNSITMNSEGISIESPAAITMNAGSDISLDAGGSLHGTGGTDLKMQGASGAELTSNAIAKVQGSLVQIN